ncbi:MAG: FAD/NAD(P)-binding protein [Pseudomonadota bacterium]
MTSDIAFVGAGPTTIYTLHALVNAASQPCTVTIFEEQASAGRGTPYRPGWNDPAMLSNIASIEIPPLEDTLVDWLRDQPASRLIALGIDPDDIGDRAFYPRLALGDYFYDQFQELIARAECKGISVTIRTRCRVLDAVSTAHGMILSVRPRNGAVFEQRFDHVVLATGHQWPASPEVRPGYFLSPWPASALGAIPPCKIGIRGTSLSAIDAAVALAVSHGDFVDQDDGGVGYVPAADTGAFSMTMMSRKGLLPEADFYHPLPYEPLSICTAEAIEALIAGPDDDLLDRAFTLFKRELAAADPDYAQRIGLEALALEDFCDRYFAERVEADPFVWAEANLAEAQRNQAARFTVPWRYAILRMHEVMALLVPHLEQEDFKRFSRYFKPVFVDDYATVPHESIQRMLALHRAGKLSILAVCDDYRIDSHRPEGGALLHLGSERLVFPVFIEATGQRPLAAKDFPFPSLLTQGIVRDAPSPDPEKASRGIVIDDQFHPISDDIPADQLFCLSLPFIMGRHPFIQGITSSHEMGLVVGAELAAAVNGDGLEATVAAE